MRRNLHSWCEWCVARTVSVPSSQAVRRFLNVFVPFSAREGPVDMLNGTERGVPAKNIFLARQRFYPSSQKNLRSGVDMSFTLTYSVVHEAE